ncbi:MAG TPA: protein translocase subunit SecF [Actinomycetes bacterium]
MSRMGTLGAKLYQGEVSYDFIARRRIWYAISAVLLVVSIGSLMFRGLTLGIEFRGGAEFRVSGPTVSEGAVLDVVNDVDKGQITVQSVGNNTVRAQTQKLTADQSQEIRDKLAQRFKVSTDEVSTQFIGPSWGKDISTKALRALIIFLFGVMLFLSLYFEWKMGAAAMIALVHDLVITAGIYSLVGFEVTPATVIGFLTILGYSLYDTVVVFDKVKENTQGIAGGSRMTYSEAANLAVNQTLVRSINTSVVALLPIGAILFAGTVMLGSGPLKDLALALFVGVAAGTYSSIFVATPLLAGFKEREPAMQALARRVAARKGGKVAAAKTEKAAAPVMEDTAEAEAEGKGEPEPAAAAATRGPSGRPAGRPAGGAQRSQPKRNPKNRPGGKKRR